MKELFEQQLKGSQPVTQEVLSGLSNDTYFNGEKIQVGDNILFAILMEGTPESEYNHRNIPMNIITLR